MPQRPPRQQRLEQACLELLSQHPDGISEYQLLKRLRGDEYGLFPVLELGDHLGLFQSHFLLFHTLYRLRDRLHAEQRAVLRISALLLELGDYEAGEVALCEADPLRDYYLDLANLAQTDEAGVEALLSDFWRQVQHHEPARIVAALAVLGLEQAEGFEQIKQQYRRLVMRYHPDRGGEAVQMQALNEALAVLRSYYHH